MTNATKRSVVVSAVLAIILCVSLISGATFALFTSESKTDISITSGKVEVLADVSNTEYKSLDTDWAAFDGNATFSVGGTVAIANGEVTLTNIVPGDGIQFQVNVKNNSNVTVKYRTLIQNTASSDATLFEALAVTVNGVEYKGATATSWSVLTPGTDGTSFTVSVILPEGVSGAEYMEKTCGFTISVQAIQGNAVTVDEVFAQEDATVDATATTTEEKTVGATEGTKAEVPAGTKLEEGKTTLTLNVTEAPAADMGNFQFEGEETLALNINIPEVADDNTSAIVITLKGYLPNKPASVALFHKGALMAPVASAAEVDAADEYFYDKNTGDIVFATDDFSNFTAVANVKVVTTENELYDIVFNQNNKYKNVHNIVLANDITLTKQMNVKNDVVIDLNGYTLTNASTSEAFNGRAAFTLKNGEIAVGTKALFNTYADVVLEDVKLSADAFGTSLLKTNGGCKSLTLNNVEIAVGSFKVNASALISINAGTMVTMNGVTVDLVLDTTYTSYFINRSASNVTMTDCTFAITDATGYEYDVVKLTDSAVDDKFGFAKNNNVMFAADANALAAAVKAAKKVVLTDNITLSTQIQIRKDVVIDLNGYTLTNGSTGEAFLCYSALTIMNGEFAVGTKAAVSTYADVAFENVKLSAGAYGTSLIKANGGCKNLTMNDVEIAVGPFKVNASPLISINAGTMVTMNGVTVDLVLDTTYTSYFINRNADHVTMTDCIFNIVDAADAGVNYTVTRIEDSAVADKYGFTELA